MNFGKKFDIIILHGWGLSRRQFQPLAQELTRLEHRVFVPDLPGFGESTLPDHPLRLVDYALFLQNYIKEQRIDKPILLGHSFGGRVSLKYNQLYPNSIAALILSGTPGFTPVAKQKIAFFIAIAKLGSGVFSLPLLSLLKARVRLWYYYVVGARDFYRAEGVMRQTFKNIVREELVTSMKAIKCRCLLAWGENDSICPVAIAKRMAGVIAGAKLVIIPEADHGVPFKEPKEFLTVIAPFLASL